MKGFQARLRTAVAAAPSPASYRQISVLAGCGEKWLSNMLSDDMLEESKTGPGFFALARLADVLNISLDSLANRPHSIASSSENRQLKALAKLATDPFERNAPGAVPSTQHLLRTHIKSGGRIEAFADTIDFANQYRPITSLEDRLELIKVGCKSLAAITMQTDEVSALQHALDEIEGTATLKQTKQDHLDTISRGTLCTTKQLNEPIPDMPVHVRMDYIATYLHVSDAKGNESVLNYTSLVI